MAQPTYIPTHRKLLTKAQASDFISALNAAKHAGDAEKAVEDAVGTLLATGLSKLHGTPTTTRYTVGGIQTDGLIDVDTFDDQHYVLLVEAKRDMHFSTNKRDVATVLAQVCWYLRALGRAATPVAPKVIVICDVDEIFAVPTTLLEHYVAGYYAWDAHAASSMHKDAELTAALIADPNIRPYVHDVAENFDADMFIWAVDAMGRDSAPTKVAVNTASVEHVFTRFKMEVLGTDATGLKNKDEIALFLEILRGSDDIYAHPKKPNTLVWGRKSLALDTYRFERFWSQYVTGGYTLEQVKSLTQMADTLIEETDRRFSGDYWTPPIWVDKSHEYIEAALGEDWKSKYICWDPAAGALNLTRDYMFDELYCSTLFQEELDIAAEYNPEATKFQYDFLNDDMILHEEGMTGERALELARAGQLKMPLALVEAMAANRPIVFYANPPYGQSGSGQGKSHKAGVNGTAVGELMDGLGHAKMELYTQFIWRTKELAKVFGYTSDFFFFFFFNKTFLTSPNFDKFTKELTSEFTFRDGFMMNAGEFNGTSSAWGVVFSHFEIGGGNQREFEYSVLISNKDMSIDRVTEWTGRTIKKGETLNDWLKQIPLPKEKRDTFLPVKNGTQASDPGKKIAGKPVVNAIGYLHTQANNVQKSSRHVGLYSSFYGDAHGRDVTPDNLERAAVTFSIRRAVQEVIAQQKLLWVRDKDIFTRPPESLLTPTFIADCMVYALFDRQSNQTSLRDYEYAGNTYRVINEFFPYSREAIVALAQTHNNMPIQRDADRDRDRIVHQWLHTHSADLSPEAQALLDLAWEIIEASFGERTTFANNPVTARYQTNTWDAGWAQINAMIFGNSRVNDEIYNRYYERFRATRRALGDKVAHAAMDAGVI